MHASTPNIGPRERRRRLLLGSAGFTAAAALMIALVAVGATWGLRALVFLPLLTGAYGFFQYREKT